MAANNNDLHLGFYTVHQDPAAGWMGGYLILNSSGRPLEFHCSLPLRPSRTQQILYGPSLDSYLTVDLIGKAVVGRAKLTPDLILSNHHNALQLATQVGVAFACFDVTKSDKVSDLIDFDGMQAIVSSGHQAKAIDVLRKLPAMFDLSEPFDRISEAFDEAKGTTRAAA